VDPPEINLPPEPAEDPAPKPHTNGVARPHEPPLGFYDEHEPREVAGIGQAPPYDLDSEAAVLSGVLVDESALPKVRPLLRPEDFYSEAHRRIFEGCLAVADKGHAPDIVLVGTWLREQDRLAQVGGLAYITEILNAAPAVANIRPYAEAVARLAADRALLLLCQQATASLYTRERPSEAIVESLRAHLERFGTRKQVETVSDVIGAWRAEGPLVHEATGIPSLDDLTGGGPVYGSRWYFVGAPDAGKTALLVEIGDAYLQRGIAVGFLAADEESGDLLIRFGQRLGSSRRDLEKRDPGLLDTVEEKLSQLPIRFYKPGTTIEAAADDLALFAKARGVKACLCVDSIQTVTCSAVVSADNAEDLSPRAIVTANVLAVRSMATRHKMILLCTSEMNRAAYRSLESAEKQSDLAAAKESGAIEYSARVMLALRSVKGEKDLIKVDFAKNKHGPSDTPVHLQINRLRMTMREVEAPTPDSQPPPVDKEAIAEEKRREKENKRAGVKSIQQARDEATVLEIVEQHPGIGTHPLRTKMSLRLAGCSKDRVDEAVEALVEKGALRTEPAPRNGKSHYLNRP
jgi:replicative DNA helicase